MHILDYNIGVLIDWDGEEGLIEDEHGEVIRVTYEDFKQSDLKFLTEGAAIILTEEGPLELASQTVPHYENDEDEIAGLGDDDDED